MLPPATANSRMRLWESVWEQRVKAESGEMCWNMNLTLFSSLALNPGTQKSTGVTQGGQRTLEGPGRGALDPAPTVCGDQLLASRCNSDKWHQVGGWKLALVGV